MSQSVADKEHILKNLPPGTMRVQVTDPSGKQGYKRPEEIDLQNDEISVNASGAPVVMRGNPGRPGKSQLLPPVTPQVAQIAAVREDYMDSNVVTRGLEKNPDGDEAFNLILKGMADEAASIEFDRLEAQRNGQEASDLATKRARILKAIADLILSRKKSSDGGVIDLESPVFQALFKLILESFRESMEEAGTRPEHVETIFAKLVIKLADPSWKEDAKNKMKSKI
jgi:hypothetical protein